MDGMLRMEMLLAVSTVIDVVAIVAAWRLAISAVQRQAEAGATLARLRTDLERLVEDAERRGGALEEAVATREKALRALLSDADKLVETRRAPAAPRTRNDPAEARLLRDLEVRLGAARSA